jgi:hypothetical protein
MALQTEILGQVGPQVLADGVPANVRLEKTGGLVIQELHGRFYEQTYRGNVYSIGCSLTALAAATATASSLGATAQLIVGVWNPLTSSVNLAILQAAIEDQVNTITTPATPGSFVWVSSTGNGSLTAGLTPFNRKTLASAGSQAKAFSLSTASLLTGLTNTCTIMEPFDYVLSTDQAQSITAAAPIPSSIGVQNVDGSIIVPPGGVLGIMNTASTTAHSASGRLLWEEIPI